jgi:hypothetical protein
MKRVFISLLVLTLTSTAGASHQIMVNGDKYPTDTQIVIMPSDELVLGIWTDSAIPTGTGSYWMLVVDSSRAFIDRYSGVALPGDPGFYIDRDRAASEAFLILPMPEDGIWGGAFDTVPPPVPADSVLFDQIIFHAIGPDDVIIKLYGSDDGSSIYLSDTVIVRFPEPMTIGLLALGALFLRRRK